VTASFAIGEQVAGGVGVLGPKRMDYRSMHALVDGMARSLTRLLTQWAQE
jgi:transcriptional regulator of heat shock response